MHMVAQVQTVTYQGIQAINVEVQVQISGGIPAFTIVGLADKAVAESRERVRSAISSIGLALPAKRITVNLAPADLQKEGSHFDLPIAIAILMAMDVIDKEIVTDFLVLGELSLDGRISEVPGILPAAVYASANHLGIICPEACGAEATWAGDINIVAPRHLLALVEHFRGKQTIAQPKKVKITKEHEGVFPCLADIKGQESAKRVLEIAAGGGHNLLMSGPPGAGKSMLAARMPGILPPLTSEEMLELSMIQSISGMLKNGQLQTNRPFRTPHHSASQAAIVGGGAKAKPGEISLAHAGILFLDELPEFQRAALESLRQPLETGTVMIARANSHVSYPSKFQLIGAMNPCRCGYLGDESRSCSKAPRCGEDYRKRLSGPLLDRIDLQIEVPAISPRELDGRESKGEVSEVVRARILKARDIQKARFQKLESQFPIAKKFNCNSDADGEVLEAMLNIDKQAYDSALEAAESKQLSARGFHRVLRVARTIADLETLSSVKINHVNEALHYRNQHYI